MHAPSSSCKQEIQRQKEVKKEQAKLEDIRVMEYLKEKEVSSAIYMYV